MSKSLVIVESPAKATTLKKFLGKGFDVKASVGHIRDLPKKKLAVDVDNNFEPEYVTIRGKGKIIAELRSAAKKAEKIYLAPDPDREGEAIAYHIESIIKDQTKGEIYRVLFNEITKTAVQSALEHPRKIDMNLFEAQQARRVLDRLVGYKISPLLWKKVQRGLSAGRVQSVALRLICEREREIQAFKPEEYWSVWSALEGKLPPAFEAKLNKIGEKKAEVKSGEQANAILSDLRDAAFTVTDVQKKERKKNPYPPFITSTLQQEASRKLRFSPKKTMTIAQMLYEGIKLGEEGSVGLITYMRTDSTRVSDEAIQGARGFVEKNFGKEFLPSEPNVYKTKKSAQDAHEAIRPTYMDKPPAEIKEYLTKDQLALYELIWNRFISSQMAQAKIDQTGVDIQAKTYIFRATGATVTFPGFMKIYVEEEEDSKEGNGQDASTAAGAEKTVILPPLAVGEKLKIQKITPKQHFTQPPPRFSEAMLIRELEEKGIGRPSTYAATVGLIKDREYVFDNNRRLFPSELGFLVSDQLVENFPDILDAAFTANMENQLDLVEEGKAGWVETLKAFYVPFKKDLEKAETAMKDFKKEGIETDEVCDKCGQKMLIKRGRFGKFMACAGYPECKTTKKIQPDGAAESSAAPKAPDIPTDEICPACGAGMVIKSGRFGKFIACSKYPDCKTTKPIGTGIKCPEEGCGGEIVEKRSRAGRSFYGCNKYPACKFASWNKPVPEKCPQCQHPFLVERHKEGEKYIACPQKECKFRKEVEEEAE